MRADLRLTRLLLVGVCLVLLTGCWNRQELNQISVALALGIDQVDDEYEITVQVVDHPQMSQNRTAERAPTVIYSVKSPSIFEALRKITQKSPRRIYIAHIRLVLLSEEVAKGGVGEALDLMFRDHEARPDFYMAITRDYSAKDILSLVTPFEVIPSMDMFKSLESSQKVWASTTTVDVVELLQRLTKDGIEPVLTGLTVIGDMKAGKKAENIQNPASKGEYLFQGIGVLKDNRLLGWLSERESNIYSYISNKVTNTVTNMDCPEGKETFVIEVTDAKTKIIPLIKNEQPVIKLEATVEGNIAEMHCSMDLTDAKSLVEIEKLATNFYKEAFIACIEKVQEEFAADIFGFGEAFHREYPYQWKTWKENWDERFKELSVDVEMEVQIRQIGKFVSPIKE